MISSHFANAESFYKESLNGENGIPMGAMKGWFELGLGLKQDHDECLNLVYKPTRYGGNTKNPPDRKGRSRKQNKKNSPQKFIPDLKLK